MISLLRTPSSIASFVRSGRRSTAARSSSMGARRVMAARILPRPSRGASAFLRAQRTLQPLGARNRRRRAGRPPAGVQGAAPDGIDQVVRARGVEADAAVVDPLADVAAVARA